MYVEEILTDRSTRKAIGRFAGLAATAVIAVVGAGACVVLFSTYAHGAYVEYNAVSRQLFVIGETVMEDSNLVGLFLDKADRGEIDLNQIVLAGPGGDMAAAIAIGKKIHDQKIDAVSIGRCASACAYMWMSGEHLSIVEGGSVWTHFPYDGNTGYVTYDKASSMVSKYLSEVGYDEEQTGKFVTMLEEAGALSPPNIFGQDHGWIDITDYLKAINKPFTVTELLTPSKDPAISPPTADEPDKVDK